MYTKEEIIAAHEALFGRRYSVALIEAALTSSGMTRFTKEEAVRLVEEFANKRVN